MQTSLTWQTCSPDQLSIEDIQDAGVFNRKLLGILARCKQHIVLIHLVIHDVETGVGRLQPGETQIG